MTIKTGKPDHETSQGGVRAGVPAQTTARGRGRGKVASTLAASAVAAVMLLAAAPTAFGAAGIAPGSPGDKSPHPTATKSTDAPASTPTPTMSGEMPGMEHGSGSTAEPDHGTGTTEGNHGAGGAAEEPAADRPLAAVLGTFGGGTAAVLLTAGFLRKKDRAADEVKAAARLARRSQK